MTVPRCRDCCPHHCPSPLTAEEAREIRNTLVMVAVRSTAFTVFFIVFLHLLQGRPF